MLLKKYTIRFRYIQGAYIYIRNQPRWAAGRGRAERAPLAPESTYCITAGAWWSWSAQMGEGASRWHSGDSKELLALIFMAAQASFVSVLSDICYKAAPAWFEVNLNHLGAGLFQMRFRLLT